MCYCSALPQFAAGFGEPKRMRIQLIWALMPVLAALGWASGDDTTRAKGIYIEGSAPQSGAAARPANPRAGVKFNVMLDRGAEEFLVPANYQFRDGDQMRFQFEVNRESYVYVLHQTVNGNPDEVSKSIEIQHDRQAPSYRLLFPTQE